MTDPMVIAGAVMVVVSGIVTGVVTVINALAQARDRYASRLQRDAIVATGASTSAKADTLITKTAEIHAVTNGTFSQMRSDLQVALAQMAGMAQHIAGQDTLIATLVRANDDRVAAERAATERKHRASDPAPGEPMRVEVMNTPLAVVTADKASS
jgi:hypothetical protein